MAYLQKDNRITTILVTGRIHKINQPENDTIIMIIRQNRKTIIYCYLFIPIFQECISPIKSTTIPLTHQCLHVSFVSI